MNKVVIEIVKGKKLSELGLKPFFILSYAVDYDKRGLGSVFLEIVSLKKIILYLHLKAG